MNEATHRLNIRRIVYVWKRYSGSKVIKDKLFNFSDIDTLEDRIDNYLRHPDKFDFNKGDTIDKHIYSKLYIKG